MTLEFYDFDKKIQIFINNSIKKFKKINWHDWLYIDSIKYYEELALKNSELNKIPNILID